MFPHCKNAIAQTVALVPFSCLLLNSLTFITPDFLLPAAAEVIKAETKERDRLLQTAKQYYQRAAFKQAIAIYQQVLSIASPEENHDAQLEAWLYLSEMDLANGQYPSAGTRIQQILQLAQQSDNRAREAEALAELSALHRLKGNYSQALSYAQTAVDRARQAGDRRVEARSRLMLGIALYFQPDYAGALASLQQALTLAQADQNQDEVAFILNWVALTQAALGDGKQAEATIQQQQQLSRSLGLRLAEYYGLGVVGLIQQGKSQPDQALKAYQQQLEIAQSADNLWLQRSALLEIAGFYVNQKQIPKALEFYQKALTLAKTIDDAAVADVQNRIGVACYQAEQYSQALAAYQQALKLYQVANRPEAVSQVWRNIGNTYLQQQQYSQALAAQQTALEVARSIPDRTLELNALMDQGFVYSRQGQALSRATAYTEAITTFEQGMDIWQQVKTLARELKTDHAEQIAIDQISLSYRGQGLALQQQQKYEEAIIAFQQDLTFLRNHRDRLSKDKSLQEEQTTLLALGTVYFQNGQYADALRAYQESLQMAERFHNLEQQNILLSLITATYSALGDYQKALKTSQQLLALVRAQANQDSASEMHALTKVGQALGNLGQHAAELTHYQQALEIARSLNEISSERTLLNNIGSTYLKQEEYLKALEPLQQSLTITQTAIQRLQSGETKAIEQLCGKNRANSGKSSQESCLRIFQIGLSSTLSNLASIYKDLGRYSEALATYEQALQIARQYKDLSLQMTFLNNIGHVYLSVGNYPKAMEFFQKSLAIARASGARPSQAVTLNNIGQVYLEQGQVATALDYYQQSLALAQAIPAPVSAAAALSNIASVYHTQGQYEQALDAYRRSLAINRKHGFSITVELNNIANVYSSQGKYAQAIEYFQQALDIVRRTGNRPREVILLQNMGLVYFSQSDYARALELFQQARQLSQAIESRSSQLLDWLILGRFYVDLGQYSQALEQLQQALVLSRDLGQKDSEATALRNMAAVYHRQGNYSQAIQFYQQALTLVREMGDIAGESSTLQKIAQAYEKQGNLTQAEELLQQALAIQRKVGARPNEAMALHTLGQVYMAQGKTVEAQEALQQSFAIAQSVGARTIQAETLAELGRLFQSQPELAIVFYKQAVNTYESIRQNLRTLSQEQQQSYTETVADTYRQLAKLLIEQKRLPEAQAVIELLKLRELRDYTRDVGINNPGISLAKIEEAVLNQILQQFATVNNFSQTLVKCEQEKCAQLEKLRRQRDQLNTAIRGEFKQHRVVLARHFATEGSLTPEKLNAVAREIVNAQPGTVLIYPLVLKDKVQFLLALKAGDRAVTFRPFETQVSAETLFNTIQTFRQQLGTPGHLKALQATSQQLYTWLIKPLESELDPATVKHIVVAPDSITRYIPLAALYDGKQYLVQRYSISTITAGSTTNVTEKFPQPGPNQPFILAMGASVFPNLPALANVPAELDAIVQTNQSKNNRGVYPGAKFLNQAFDYANLKHHLKDHRVLHLATHGKFIPGRPEESFLVPGRGENITTQLIETLSDYGLGNIHLVTLSACETAVGDRASDGMEIPGLSHYFLMHAKSVLASLWAVNDASTALMMQQFYQKLAQNNLTKAEALRQAQLELIQGRLTARDAPPRSDVEVQSMDNQPPADFSHPYYWAPFILIGNSL